MKPKISVIWGPPVITKIGVKEQNAYHVSNPRTCPKGVSTMTWSQKIVLKQNKKGKNNVISIVCLYFSLFRIPTSAVYYYR